MKKLLIIAPQNCYPPTDGGRIGIYFPLLALSKFFEIHFVFLYQKELPVDIHSHYADYGIKIYPQWLNTNDSFVGLCKNVISEMPYKFQKYCTVKIKNIIAGIINDNNIKNVWCNHSHVAWYALQLKKNSALKIYLREHNIEYDLVYQYYITSRNPLYKFISYVQFVKTKKFEKHLWSKFDKTFFISDSDLKISDAGGAAIAKKLLYDAPAKTDKVTLKTETAEPHSFVFTGNFKTFQNEYNLIHFINHIWKPLIKEAPHWKLYVTGTAPDIIQAKLDIDVHAYNIISMGFVEDVEAFVALKKYFVSPTMIGSGVRIKVLNAMKIGIACFLSPVDAVSLSVYKDLHNMVTFRDFKEFYQKLLLLEANETLYNTICKNAQADIKIFSWERYAITVNNEVN